ncbi:MAG: lasso peptide biosynthesis B2 protein [Myxococcales bacterium]|nr:lasso peptide biosynthesis B2 protein [Myxococcales bacterium]
MDSTLQLRDLHLLTRTLFLRSSLLFRRLDDPRIPVDAALMQWLPAIRDTMDSGSHMQTLADIERITTLVCNRWRLTRTTCLPRALIRARLLRERGIDARVHVGVNQTSEFRAHAWITVDAQPLMETGVLDYTEIMQLPPTGPSP